MIEVNIERTRALTILATLLAAQGCANEAALPGTNGEDRDAAKASRDEDAGMTTTEQTTSTQEANTSADASSFLVPDGVGEEQVTQVYSGETHMVGDARATLRATSDEIEVYVDDVFWGTKVTDTQLNAFMHRLIDRGAAESYRPDLGVLATNEEVFGALRRENLPNGKQRVFVVDTSGAGDGYLCGWCDYPDLHLDGNLVAPLDGDVAVSISAHELFHGIHRGYDADEEVWLDETLAEAAMSVNGLFTDDEWLGNYLDNPNVAWGPHGADVASVHYGACLAWGSYLWEQGGPALMRAMTSEPMNGWAGLEAALSQVGEARSASALFLEMGAALYYDEPERGLGFESFDLSRAVPSRSLTAGSAHSVSLKPYGLVHVSLETGGTLRLEPQSDDVMVGFVAESASRALQLLDPAQSVEVTTGLVVVSATTETTLRVSLE